jgi:hypothetical protein
MWINALEYFIAGYFVSLILILTWKVVILDLNHTLVNEELIAKSSDMTNLIELLSKREDEDGICEFNEYRTLIKEMAKYKNLSLQSTYIKQLWIFNVLRQIYFAYKFRSLAKTKFQTFFESHSSGMVELTMVNE